MIWLLLKIFVFVVAVAGLIFALEFAVNSGNVLMFTVGGWEFTPDPIFLVVSLILLLLAAWLFIQLVNFLFAVIRFCLGDETALSRYFDKRRRKKADQALLDALIALAEGDAKQALPLIHRAQYLLGGSGVTSLLIAQANEELGNYSEALEAYKKLLGQKKTRFVAIRGLLRQKLARNDKKMALKLAEKAFLMKPKHQEIQDTLLRLQIEQSDWKGARATLEAKFKTKGLPKDVFRRRDAILALEQAQSVMGLSDQSAKGLLIDKKIDPNILKNAPHEAVENVLKSNRLSPGLVPSAVMVALIFTAKGEKKVATNVLKKAWEIAPHPELAAAFAFINPDETPLERIARFKLLTRYHAKHEETRLLQAELALAAEDFSAARQALGDIVKTHPTQRSLAIMAAIEKGSGANEAVVMGWLAKALTSAQGPQWCCDNCQAIHRHWQATCDNCHSFDTLSWREPIEDTGPSITGAELLPVLLGRSLKGLSDVPEEQSPPDHESPEDAGDVDTIRTT